MLSLMMSFSYECTVQSEYKLAFLLRRPSGPNANISIPIEHYLYNIWQQEIKPKPHFKKSDRYVTAREMHRVRKSSTRIKLIHPPQKK